MEKRIHLYVSRKNFFLWFALLTFFASSVMRIISACLVESYCANIWSGLVLPIGATALLAIFLIVMGKEMFYKTAIPFFLMGVHYCFFANPLLPNRPVVMALVCVCIGFFWLLYTALSSGMIRFPWLLLPMMLGGGAVMAYIQYSMLPETVIPDAWLYMLPEYLFFGGCAVMCIAIRVHPQGEYHPTWGDRSDGRRIRTLPPMAQVSPYIMVTRNTSSNFFTDSIEISNIERYIRQKRREGYSNFGLTHVLLAAYVRGVAKYPGLNRFLAGQKVYSRDTDIQYCMTIKKEMVNNAPDTVVKVHLHPGDTAIDVYNKLNAEIEKVKATPLDSSFDNTAGALTLIPGVFLKFTVWLLRTMDYFGLLPKFLLEVSPFHGSLFYTSMGSLGIQPIYHHLYDFGNMPAFGAFGCKRKVYEMNEEGEVVTRKYVDIKFVLDERIVDGYYYATFFKYFKRILARPEVLDNPPEEIVKDID